MKITISNLQKKRNPNRREILELAEHFMDRVGTLRPDLFWSDLTLILTDDEGIRSINRRALNKDAATDVICFRFDPVPGDPSPGQHVEIVLNVERAWKEGRSRRGWSPSRELALYLAHGCDHLTGWNDDDARDAARMRRRELRWLRDRLPKTLMD